MITMSNSSAIRYQYSNISESMHPIIRIRKSFTPVHLYWMRLWERRVWGQTSRICIIRWFHAHTRMAFSCFTLHFENDMRTISRILNPPDRMTIIFPSAIVISNQREECAVVLVCVSLDQRVTIFGGLWGRKSSFVPGWYLHNSVN